jgi:hypothetical protein
MISQIKLCDNKADVFSYSFFFISSHILFNIFSKLIFLILFIGGQRMATYECSICGMAVNATCAKCDAPLVNDTIIAEDGSEIQVSKCPNGHGKIKSPQCCGQDMVCTVH